MHACRDRAVLVHALCMLTFSSHCTSPQMYLCPPGANLDVDVPWKWLNFFLEDDARLEQVRGPQGWAGGRKVHCAARAGSALSPCAQHRCAAATCRQPAAAHADQPPAPPCPIPPWQIGREYASGRMLTGEIKGELIAVLVEMVERHNAARALVTDDVVDAFMAVRPMDDLWG